MNKPLHLVITKDSTNQLAVPKSNYGTIQIDSVSFGTSTIRCDVLYSNELTDEIRLSENLAQKLMIPYASRITPIIHDKNFHLGSLVGVFTAGFTESPLRPIGERSLFFAKLLSVEKSVGAYAFVFGAHHIHWEQGTITGLFYHGDRWIQAEVPFPNVIYDRLPNRRTENHRALKVIKERLTSEYLIPWYNPGFFNKWEIHKQLVNHSTLSPHIPDTHRNPSITLIEEMLSKYKHVYLKPVNGSLGIGVFQILYTREDGYYYCRYKDENDEKKLKRFTTLESLLSYLMKKKRLEDYLVQQGISLLRIDQRSVDFRVHTNKNVNGEWEVTVIAAKIAGRGSVTTHLNSGGKVHTLDEIYKNPLERDRIESELRNLALSLSKVIDEKIEGHIGEIGFDLGIDKAHHVWLFEANSKPGRSIFSHPKLKENDLLTRKLPLQYAIYLTEKAIKKPEDVEV